MRTIGFRTRVVLVLVGAVGILTALSRPWYAAAPPPASTEIGVGEVSGPLESLYSGLQRWVTEADGTTGWAALGSSGTLLGFLSVATAFAALMTAAPALQGVGRELLRYGAFAVAAIAVWRLVDPPGANDMLELRFGAFLGASCAVMLVTSAMGLANAPLRRRIAPARFVAPPPPEPFEPR
jgi:hypothetical protein